MLGNLHIDKTAPDPRLRNVFVSRPYGYDRNI